MFAGRYTYLGSWGRSGYQFVWGHSGFDRATSRERALRALCLWRPCPMLRQTGRRKRRRRRSSL